MKSYTSPLLIYSFVLKFKTVSASVCRDVNSAKDNQLPEKYKQNLVET